MLSLQLVKLSVKHLTKEKTKEKEQFLHVHQAGLLT